MTLTLEEAVFGVEKDITYPKHESCARCTGQGDRARQAAGVTCTRCNGTGELRRTHQSIFGQMVNVSMCDRCLVRADHPGSVRRVPGPGVVRVTRTLRVSIPVSIDDNSQIRLAGEGEPGLKAAWPSNLYLLVHVQPHRYFHRQGNELLVELPINVAQAALGDELEIESLDGPVIIKVLANTQNGRTSASVARASPTCASRTGATCWCG